MDNINNLGVRKGLLEQLAKLRRHNRQLSYKTRERYYEAMKRFCTFLSSHYHLQKLANIAPKHITAYVSDMQGRGRSATYIKTELSAIRFWHDKISNARHTLKPNDGLSLERRKFGKVDRTWSDTELERIFCVCRELGRNDYVAVIHLARYAGLRIHECLRIDTAIAGKAISNMEIRIKGKGGKIRTVPINECIRTELENMLAVTKRGNKLFVPGSEQTHLIKGKLQQFIINHRGKVQDPDSKRPMTFHGLRHSCAADWYTSLRADGYSDLYARKQVSIWLGHERAEITKIYLASVEGD